MYYILLNIYLHNYVYTKLQIYMCVCTLNYILYVCMLNYTYTNYIYICLYILNYRYICFVYFIFCNLVYIHTYGSWQFLSSNSVVLNLPKGCNALV